MTKVLYAYGDDDYGALQFEQKYKTEEHLALWEKINKSDEDYFEFSDGCYVEAMEFGEVDPEFISFVFDKMVDYDSSKHTNFIIVDD